VQSDESAGCPACESVRLPWPPDQECHSHGRAPVAAPLSGAARNAAAPPQAWPRCVGRRRRAAECGRARGVAPTAGSVGIDVRGETVSQVSSSRASTNHTPRALPSSSMAPTMAASLSMPSTPRDCGRECGFALPPLLCLHAGAASPAHSGSASDAGSARDGGEAKSGAHARRQRALVAGCGAARRRTWKDGNRGLPWQRARPPPLGRAAAARAATLFADAPASFAAGVKRAAPRAWSEDEHDAFLAGLAELKRGNWAAISRQFLGGARTPAQVRAAARLRRWQGTCRWDPCKAVCPLSDAALARRRRLRATRRSTSCASRRPSAAAWHRSRCVRAPLAGARRNRLFVRGHTSAPPPNAGRLTRIASTRPPRNAATPAARQAAARRRGQRVRGTCGRHRPRKSALQPTARTCPKRAADALLLLRSTQMVPAAARSPRAPAGRPRRRVLRASCRLLPPR
jgi:hypothetical protein